MKDIVRWIMSFLRKEWFLLVVVVVIALIILLFELL